MVGGCGVCAYVHMHWVCLCACAHLCVETRTELAVTGGKMIIQRNNKNVWEHFNIGIIVIIEIINIFLY